MTEVSSGSGSGPSGPSSTGTSDSFLHGPVPESETLLSGAEELTDAPRMIGGRMSLEEGAAMDGWRAWAALGGAFFTTFVELGFTTSFGIFFDFLQGALGLSNTQTAIIPSLLSGVHSGFGLFVPLLYDTLGGRLNLLLGCTTSTLGLLSAANAANVAQLYVSVVAIGIGFSISHVTSIVALLEYFEAWRLFALTFASVGAATGSATVPTISLFLLRRLGWRSTFVVLAGCTSAFTVVAAIDRSRRRRNPAPSLQHMLRIRLVKKKTFWLVCLMFLLWGSAYAFFYLEVKVLESKGMGPAVASHIMMVQGLTNIVARVASAFINHRQKTNRLALNAAATGLWALSILLFGLASGAGTAYAAAAFFGAGYGLMFSGVQALLLELFGAEDMTAAYGLAICALGVGQFSLPPLTSEVGRISGSFEAAFGTIAGFGLLSALIAGVMAAHRRVYTKDYDVAKCRRGTPLSRVVSSITTL